jgi:hypothetical protein
MKLFCVLIDDNLRILDSAFSIKVPPEEDFGEIIHYVKEITPSLKDKDHRKFTFFKPPSGHAIHISHSLSGSQLAPEHLENPLLITCTVHEEFPEKYTDNKSVVDLIIYVKSGDHSTFSTRQLI